MQNMGEGMLGLGDVGWNFEVSSAEDTLVACWDQFESFLWRKLLAAAKT